MSPVTCPDIPQLQAILDEPGTAREPADLLCHLETCVDCQHTLETLAADPALWQEATHGIARRTPHEPALQNVVARLKDEPRALPAADDDLGFLQPCDEPGHRGQFGGYKICAEVGRGSMGVVLKAVEPALNRVVALKVLSPRLATSSAARMRFVREGRAAAAVVHDHIVPVYGVSEADGLPYLAMQYIDGESLQQRLDRAGPSPIEDIVRVGYQTASGLAAAHAHGLIHRDIKPANLLLEQDPPRVRITDFGLARTADDVQLTQVGVVTGTPEFMAPEQARAEPVDLRADLFSLGSVLYALCTGVPPFRGATALAVLRQVTDQEPAAIRALRPEVPAWLEALIARLMAKDREQRCQSAAEVAGLLRGYALHLQQPETSAAPSLPAGPASTSVWQAASRPLSRLAKWLPRHLRLPGFLLLASLAGGLSVHLGTAPDPGPEPSSELHQDFRGAQEPRAPLCLAGANAAALTRAEADGLRVTLPATRKQVDPVGVEMTTPVQGDFEITCTYEILRADHPSTGNGVGFELYIATDTPTREGLAFSRIASADEGEVYLCKRMTTQDGKREHHGRFFQAKGSAGQLRVTRQGGTVTCWTSQGADSAFQELCSAELGSEDLKMVRLAANSGNDPQNVDLRIVELTIRSGAPIRTQPAHARGMVDRPQSS